MTTNPPPDVPEWATEAERLPETRPSEPDPPIKVGKVRLAKVRSARGANPPRRANITP